MFERELREEIAYLERRLAWTRDQLAELLMGAPHAYRYGDFGKCGFWIPTVGGGMHSCAQPRDSKIHTDGAGKSLDSGSGRG